MELLNAKNSQQQNQSNQQSTIYLSDDAQSTTTESNDSIGICSTISQMTSLDTVNVVEDFGGEGERSLEECLQK
jgi:cell division protein FtsX